MEAARSTKGGSENVTKITGIGRLYVWKMFGPSQSLSSQTNIPLSTHHPMGDWGVHTLEKLTQEALDLETMPHAVQGQVTELKIRALCKKLYTELWKPQAPPFPASRMSTTKHMPTTTTPTSTQSEILWRYRKVPEERSQDTDIRVGSSLPHHPTVKPF